MQKTTGSATRHLIDRPKTGKVTFLPEPVPEPRTFTVISVDDHVVEPPDTFEGRFPSELAERAPRLIEHEGDLGWLFEDELNVISGGGASAGRPPSEFTLDGITYDEMRRGCWDIDARVSDMDLNGVYASINFPSGFPGFSGRKFYMAKDQELGLATMRAWNSWHLEDWAGRHPGRIIPCQLAWLADPDIAAREIRKNSELGFHALTFPEFPEKLGLPSVNTRHWDPVFQACVDTGTVLCLHVGSAGWVATGSSDSPADVVASLFFVSSLIATSDWLFSGIPVRFPQLQIAISEGGIGWVPALIDRIRHCTRYKEFTGGWTYREDPVDVLRRNFFFCALDDVAGFEVIDHIGADHVMVEVDYPHNDTTWPDTQAHLKSQLACLSDDVIRKVTWENASKLFQHPVPAEVLAEVAPYERPAMDARAGS